MDRSESVATIYQSEEPSERAKSAGFQMENPRVLTFHEALSSRSARQTSNFPAVYPRRKKKDRIPFLSRDYCVHSSSLPCDPRNNVYSGIRRLSLRETHSAKEEEEIEEGKVLERRTVEGQRRARWMELGMGRGDKERKEKKQSEWKF